MFNELPLRVPFFSFTFRVIMPDLASGGGGGGYLGEGRKKGVPHSRGHTVCPTKLPDCKQLQGRAEAALLAGNQSIHASVHTERVLNLRPLFWYEVILGTVLPRSIGNPRSDLLPVASCDYAFPFNRYFSRWNFPTMPR